MTAEQNFEFPGHRANAVIQTAEHGSFLLHFQSTIAFSRIIEPTTRCYIGVGGGEGGGDKPCVQLN